jgi:hypothetical protein
MEFFNQGDKEKQLGLPVSIHGQTLVSTGSALFSFGEEAFAFTNSAPQEKVCKACL